jgi:Transposase DDE domain
VTLGKLRRVSGHFVGRVLAIDPHRLHSYSQRQMRRRKADAHSRPQKLVPTFFVLDADTHQPICFTTATAARTVSSASQELLALAAEILDPQPKQTLVTADAEHFCTTLLDHIHTQTKFDLLVPTARQAPTAWADATFTPHWAGYATCIRPYHPRRSQAGPFWQFIQRFGERPEKYTYKAFVSTTERDPVRLLCEEFPKRWHIEEFFDADQDLGWQRAGTQNLNIRYGQMTMALIAQTVLHQLRQRLGLPLSQWDSGHLATGLLRGIEGDIRVGEDTVVVTYYNAPELEHLRPHYEGLPQRLQAEGIDPRIPWLYNFKIDFRFR